MPKKKTQEALDKLILSTYSQTENITTVGDERFCCAEVLFQPSFIGEEASDTSFQDITKCDVDPRKNFYAMTCSQVARPCFKGFLSA